MQTQISTGRRRLQSAELQTMPEANARRSNMAAAQSSEHPAWVLLDTTARIGSCCRNETTAEAKTSDGHDIVVSFSVTDPLAGGLSRCFVHCPDLAAEEEDYFSGKPRVTGADGALLLIRVNFAPRHGRWKFTDMFVYRAGPGAPSLCLLPSPYPLYILCDHVGLLSCGEEHYLVVVPDIRFEAGGRRAYYDLSVFSSETLSWRIIVAPVAVDGDTNYRLLVDHSPTKVISIGGIWLAWIDLRRGVLLCNMLDKLPEMRLIQFPTLLGTNRVEFAPFDGVEPTLRQIRDVSCSDGLIRFIEIEYPDSDNGCSDTELRWVATMFTREISSGNYWHWCCTVNAADISATDTCSLDLFPEIWDCVGKKLTFNTVISSAPTLDLYDDDLFYMMAKLNVDDSSGWVLAINVTKLTLENVVPFSTEDIFLDPTYQQCAFSRHFGKASGLQVQTIQLPALIPGTRCFVDASTEPDSPIHLMRPAGLGIFIVNTHVHPANMIYIKAYLQATSSVIMAEAAALALAAKIIAGLQLLQVSFLSDNLQLVQFLNSSDHNHPPDWRMKTFSQEFDNCIQVGPANLFKVTRENNITSDTLAKQALQDGLNLNQTLHSSCSCTHHGSQCSVIQALSSVTLPSVRLLTASCC